MVEAPRVFKAFKMYAGRPGKTTTILLGIFLFNPGKLVG